MSSPPTIIIADRDPMFSSSLRVAFSDIGFAVLLPVDAADALTFATCTDANLVVLDVSPPGLTGYDACARIRRQPGYAATPIVLTARDLLPKIQAAATAAGATSTLGKPYSFNDLLDSVAQHLPADHPLLIHRPTAPCAREVQWGPPRPLNYPSANDSGLSRNQAIMRVVRTSGVKIPLKRIT